MHPIERLRYVARAGGADHALVAEETAQALAGFVDDPGGLVTACRRMLERHPTSGPLWWMCSRVLASNDPRAESFRCVSALQGDKSAAALAYELPDDRTVAVIGWPEIVGEALVRRGDVRALVVDALGEGAGLVRRLERSDNVADEVPPASLGGAVRCADLLLVEASAVGPDAFVAITGSWPAAAVAASVETEVWLVVGEGRQLAGPVWEHLVARMTADDEAWELDEEVVPLTLVDKVVGPRGLETVDAMLRRVDTPVVPELLR